MYGGPKVSRQFQFAHGNFNSAHGSFNFAHGSFNLLTAISICSRQFQFAHGSFNLLTAVSISRQFQFRSRQFQFAHGNFNLLTAVSISLTAISICSRQFQFAHGSFNFAHGNFNLLTAVSTSLAAPQVHCGLLPRTQRLGHIVCGGILREKGSWKITQAVRCFVKVVVLQPYLRNIFARTVDRVSFMSLHCSQK